MLDDFANATTYYEKLKDKATKVRHLPMLSTAYAGLADVCLKTGDREHRELALENARQAVAQAEALGPGVELGVGHPDLETHGWLWAT